jgi:hypothetical protein
MSSLVTLRSSMLGGVHFKISPCVISTDTVHSGAVRSRDPFDILDGNLCLEWDVEVREWVSVGD